MIRIILLIFFMLTCAMSQESWQVCGTMPHPVSGGQALVIGSQIYIFGGYSDSLRRPVNDIQIYHPESNTWEMDGRMRFARYGFVAAKANDSSIVYCGGIWNNTDDFFSLEIWNPNANSVLMPEVQYSDINFNRLFFTGHVYREQLYLFGGLSSPANLDTVRLPYIVRYQINDKATSIIEEKLYEGTFLPYHHMSVLKDSLVYLIGGVHFNVTNRVLIFNLESFRLTTAGKLNGVRAGGATVEYKDNIYVIGGYNESSKASNSTEMYSLITNTSRPGLRLNHARQELMAVVYQDEIYVFGGKNQYDQNVPYVEKLDLVTSFAAANSANPHNFSLYDNYPNPFNSATTLQFSINNSEYIRLDIYSITGQFITNIFSGNVSPGRHKYIWNGTDGNNVPVTSGVYIYRLSGAGKSISAKMILLR